MSRNSNFFKDQRENIKELFYKAKNLHQNDRRSFCQIITKTLITFLFWITLLLPAFGSIKNTNILDMPIGFLWFVLYFLFPFVYATFALSGKERRSQLLFKIGTIIGIGIVGYELLTFLLVVIDSTLVSPSIKFGFYLSSAFIVIMSLLLWREKIVMNVIYKIFKVPDIEEVEYVSKKDLNSKK